MGVATGCAIVACRQLVGIQDEPPSAGAIDGGAADTEGADTTTDAGLAWTSPGCGSCVEQSCSAELAACIAEVPCAQSVRCLAACAGDDDTCRGACFTQGDDTLAALLRCQATSCSSESACSLQCGGFFGPAETLSAACTACYVQYGCAQGTWCATQSLACLGSQICTDACNPLDWICLLDCYASHPDDVPDAAWGGDFSVANAQCGSVCGHDDVWRCVGRAEWPAARTTVVTFKVQVVDVVSGAALSGVQLRLCANGDTTCSTPLPTGTTTTDDGGSATITAPAPFGGYIEATTVGYPAELSYVYPPIAENLSPDDYVGVQLLSSTYVSTLANAVGVPVDPSRGIVIAGPHDCNGEPAPGVSFEIEPKDDAGVVYYLLNGVPTQPPSATATSAPSPLGGFVDVEPGSVTFSATVDGGLVSKVSVSVRPGAVTWLRNLVPTP
jgi:hypothetical protein